jgi:hypothetical protein
MDVQLLIQSVNDVFVLLKEIREMDIIQHVFNLFETIQLTKMNLTVCFEDLYEIIFFCFKDLCELNRNTYNRVRTWFDQLDAYRRTLISRRLEGYPPCDDLTLESRKYLYLLTISSRQGLFLTEEFKCLEGVETYRCIISEFVYMFYDYLF